MEALPIFGLVTTIAAAYLVSSLSLDQTAAIDSPWFLPISMIYAERPKFLGGICAGAEHRIAVFLSEFTPAVCG
jgi:predicted ATP-grasp superfamily ATP-dependent carboligase